MWSISARLEPFNKALSVTSMIQWIKMESHRASLSLSSLKIDIFNGDAFYVIGSMVPIPIKVRLPQKESIHVLYLSYAKVTKELINVMLSVRSIVEGLVVYTSKGYFINYT